MKIAKFYALLFLLILIVGCEKEEDFIIPTVITKEVSDIGLLTATFNGEIINLGNRPVRDFGFVWAEEPSFNAQSSRVQSLGSNPAVGPFSASITHLKASQTYFLKTFLKVENQIFYGEPIQFSLLSPSITSVSPAEVNLGDTITLKGHNFIADISKITVKIDGQELSLVSASDTSIRAALPKRMTAGKYKVNLCIDGGAAISPTETFVLPTLQSAIPAVANIGSNIILEGKGFSSNAGENKVYFDNVPAQVNYTSMSTITTGQISLNITIPFAADLGNQKLTVVVREARSKVLSALRVTGWKMIATAPFKKAVPFHFVLHDKLYVGGGLHFSPSLDVIPTNDFWRFDPATNKWTQLADFPGGKLLAATSFALNNIGYVGLGVETFKEGTSDFWKYDPGTNQWTKIANYPRPNRDGSVSFVIGKTAFVGTGVERGVTELADFYSYNPATNQWSPIARFGGGPIYSTGAFSIGKKAYVVGGVKNATDRLATCWEYDSELNTWQQKSDFKGGLRFDGAGFAIGEQGYFGLGSVQNLQEEVDIWEYNNHQDSWNQLMTFYGHPRNGSVSGTIGSYGYYGFGSEKNTVFDDIWLFNPK